MNRKIKVLIVDDSITIQDTLKHILMQDPEIEVIGCASDPYQAVNKIAENLPDVITLDLEMPRMNGLTFLSKLMKQHPIPVVIISSFAELGSDLGLKALILGACEVIPKPKLSNQIMFEEYSIKITDAIKASFIAGNNTGNSYNKGVKKNIVEQNDVINTKNNLASDKLILIGASTGGTEIISKILRSVKVNVPGIIIVQHMPGEFTKSFADRLNSESKLNVKEAENNELIKNGNVYIANGNYHLGVKKINGNYVCKLCEGQLVNRHRPSVDFLFNSAAKLPGNKVFAALLTGMGFDGAKGLLNLRNIGAWTFAQDKKSSVIFGMPGEAIKINAANMIGDPDDLINWINDNF